MRPASARDLVVTRWGARFAGRQFACATGWGGIRMHKREGDGATPVGRYRLTGGVWRPDRGVRPAGGVPLRPVGMRDGWSDDPGDPAYNAAVTHPHPFSAERLWRADGLYDVCLFTSHNRAPATPGAGSAIFVHLWRGPRVPTAGCVAFRRRDLAWILARWTHRSALVVRG